MRNKIIFLLSLLTFISLLSGTTLGNEANIKQNINQLDDSLNGKILKSKKVKVNKNLLNEFDKTIIDKHSFYKIRYLSDGLEVVGYMVRPRKEGNYPVIIYNRGGNREFGKIKKSTLAFFSYLASEKYVIIGSQYRGNDGGEGREEFGGKDVNDVLNLVPLVKSLDCTQQNKIGMLGLSRGGMMTYLAIKNDIDIDAAVVMGGVTDLIQNYNERGEKMREVLEELIGGSPSKYEQEYKKRSAYYWPEKIDKPTLILHGKFDWRVDVSQAKKLANKLEKLNKTHKLIIYKDDHGLTNSINKWTKEMYKWFDKHLE